MTASAEVKNPQTLNRYSYGLNSPYKFVDPLGLRGSDLSCFGNTSGGGANSIGSCEAQRSLMFYEERLQNTMDTIAINQAVANGDQATARSRCASNENVTCTTGPSTSSLDNLMTLERLLYYIFDEDDPNWRGSVVFLPDEVNDVLNDYAQGIANNELKKLLALNALEKYPETSYTLGFDSTLGTPGIGVGTSESHTYSSKDAVLAAQVIADNELYLKAYDKIVGVRALVPGTNNIMRIGDMGTAVPGQKMANLLLNKANRRAWLAATGRWINTGHTYRMTIP